MNDFQVLEIIKNVLNPTEFKAVAIEDWKKLIGRVRTIGLLPCIAYYSEMLPEEQKPDVDIVAFLKNSLIQSTVFSANQLYAAEEMQRTFEENGVCNLIVKGIKTKSRYPDEVLRTMGDIDILYKPEQHKQVYELMKSLKYDGYQEGRKNDTYTRDPHIMVEAHRQLVSSESVFLDYLDSVWDRAVLCKGCSYTYEMTVEDEFIYNIIHLVEHFKHGGVGIRFIMDIAVYKRIPMNQDYLKNELTKLGIYDFYLNISALAEYWFGNGKSTDLLDRLGEYILSSGVFGNHKNSSALSVSEKGKIGVFLKACFPNYKGMVSMFPWLKKFPFLLPVAWIIRGFNTITKRKNHIQIYMNIAKDGDVKKGKELKAFYEECGLS